MCVSEMASAMTTTATAVPIKVEVDGKVEVRKRSACPLCFKTFFRKSHMLRHVQQRKLLKIQLCIFFIVLP